MQYVNIKKDLVDRTINILTENENHNFTMHDVTLLLICMITILAIPYETRNNEKVNNYKKEKDIVDKMLDFDVNFNKKAMINNKECIAMLRHGIAHVNIVQTEYQNDKISKLKIYNRKALVIEATPEDLKKLIFYIGEKVSKLL